MRKVRDATAQILDGTSLADVCRLTDSLREMLLEADRDDSELESITSKLLNE